MLHIVLFEPEIPPNTGNIIRLCANIGTELHLIKPYGFDLSNKQLRRAGLDYHEFANVREYDSYDDFSGTFKPARIYPVSTRGRTIYSDIKFQDGDVLLFGPETRGLPESLLKTFSPHEVLRIPMKAQSRSLNLSNTVAIILYEALRQAGFISIS